MRNGSFVVVYGYFRKQAFAAGAAIQLGFLGAEKTRFTAQQPAV
jgi:hypothetical protein